MIIGNVIGGIMKIPDTIILVDEEDDTEYTAVSTNEEVELDATANDIRLGTTAATETGVTEGTKVIPAYHVTEGTRLITEGSKVTIPNINTLIDSYDYTKMEAMICLYNSNIAGSVSTEKVAIDSNVYNVQSIDSIAEVIKNHESKLIDFGISNDSNSMWVLRYFMYKEIL